LKIREHNREYIKAHRKEIYNKYKEKNPEKIRDIKEDIIKN